MKTLPAAIVLEKNKLATGSAWLTFVKIKMTDGTIYRLVRNNENVVYTDSEYDDLNCLAHWKLNDDAANTTVVDSSGNETQEEIFPFGAL